MSAKYKPALKTIISGGLITPIPDQLQLINLLYWPKSESRCPHQVLFTGACWPISVGRTLACCAHAAAELP